MAFTTYSQRKNKNKVGIRKTCVMQNCANLITRETHLHDLRNKALVIGTLGKSCGTTAPTQKRKSQLYRLSIPTFIRDSHPAGAPGAAGAAGAGADTGVAGAGVAVGLQIHNQAL
jgi:hypothetical protein